MENTPDLNQSGEYTTSQQTTSTTNYGQQDPNKAVMTMGEWLITLIIMAIPLINIIMLFVWGFGNGNENRKNFCRAELIITLICAVLGFLFGSLIVGALIAMFKDQTINSTLFILSNLFI